MASSIRHLDGQPYTPRELLYLIGSAVIGTIIFVVIGLLLFTDSAQ